MDLSDRLGVSVREENLRSTGVKAKSGHCVVGGEPVFVMDKHKPLEDKNEILIEFLRTMPHEDIFVVPAVRELLGKQPGQVTR